MRKVLFLDRDGVINKDVNYLYRIDDLQWVDGAKEALAYAYSKGYDLIVVTNQSGVARGYYTEHDVQILHEYMGRELDACGAPILRFYYCPHHVEGTVSRYAVECECRKPKPGMIYQAIKDYDVNVGESFLIGDSPRDIEAAEAAGIKGYLFTGTNLLDFIKTII
ncbi:MULTISPECIES: D-glycero-beta-D-manno-heptose 1,7-bisphosphate 7-phosphatase [Veillonella]|uniref:D,D-heptose 1,7-bisphosphate phosphatase n=1 Tax=Veillonella denticariosi JCM 15641 TaxID=1298594 RepID=A0A2S7Z6Y8_9FIRM|nr:MULTISPECIES: HAD family hydrolase [Veillonella]ETS93796.1 D,D-heptose 1,7-bisphosphate phosphatase [Veillonella sp. AS16]PQL18955.1 HAD family hydrolase [Veillonella denticariosi JCM 15641]